jgi:glycosyltransferase involved in cell wall biosynthesis
MDDDGFPRVLAVTAEPFGLPTPTGVSLGNLFDGWPARRLAQVYTLAIEPQARWCGTYLHVAGRNAPLEYVGRKLLTRRGRSVLRGAPMTPAVRLDRRGGSARASWHARLRAAADLSPVWIPRGLLERVRDFRPDVVYSTLGSVRMMRLAIRLARVCERPLVAHFMDDWPTTLYSGGELLGYARRAVHAGLRGVVRAGDRGIGISGAMAGEFQRRYGLPFAAFGNCVDDSSFSPPGSAAEPAGGGDAAAADRPVRLVYVGGLHLDRWQPLRGIAAALDAIDAPGAPNARGHLTIYAPERDLAAHGVRLAGFRNTRLAASLSAAEVPGVMRTADVLVHVESFDERLQEYTRFSLSTKIPQYMAAGRAVFGHGPEDLASMWHIRSAGAGLVVGTPDQPALAARLAEICADPGLRHRLASAGYSYARRHHRKPQVAADFAAYLRDAAVDAGRRRTEVAMPG